MMATSLSLLVLVAPQCADPLTSFMFGEISVPPVPTCEGAPLNWWAIDLDMPASMRDARTSWVPAPKAIPPTPDTKGKPGAGGPGGAGAPKRQVSRGSLPSAAEGRLEFAALRNALADDEDEMEEEDFLAAASGVNVDLLSPCD